MSRINDNMLAKYPGSVGLLMPNMTGRIVGEDGRDVPVGEVGELWVRGPNIVKYDSPSSDTKRRADLHPEDTSETQKRTKKPSRRMVGCGLEISSSEMRKGSCGSSIGRKSS